MITNREQFKRWKVIDENHALLKMNATSFSHAVQEINDEIEKFLISEYLPYGEKTDITLIFEGMKYPAYIKVLKSGRMRLYFRKGPLKDILKLRFPQYKQEQFEFPLMEWERMPNNEYKISFVDHIDSGENAALDRTTVVVKSGKEGKEIRKYITVYERRPELRLEAKRIHGTFCAVCGFDFFETYGELGEGFIEVHHKQPVSQSGEMVIDPEKDLTCVCSNCHSMLHRNQNAILTIDDLRERIHQRSKK